MSDLPSEVLVGLISFNRAVSVHDLSVDSIKHSFIFRGGKDITARELQVSNIFVVLSRLKLTLFNSIDLKEYCILMQRQLGMGSYPIGPYLQSPKSRTRSGKSHAAASPENQRAAQNR